MFPFCFFIFSFPTHSLGSCGFWWGSPSEWRDGGTATGASGIGAGWRRGSARAGGRAESSELRRGVPARGVAVGRPQARAAVASMLGQRAKSGDGRLAVESYCGVVVASCCRPRRRSDWRGLASRVVATGRSGAAAANAGVADGGAAEPSGAGLGRSWSE